MTELLEALYRGDDERVAELLGAEPELNVFEAAAFGRTDRLRELVDADTTLANAYGDDGFQPLGLACFFGHVETARLLLDREADPNSLARNEHLQVAPLHSASASENKDAQTHYELCELLLDRGPDPKREQNAGFRPIDSARLTGDEPLERVILDRGARP